MAMMYNLARMTTATTGTGTITLGSNVSGFLTFAQSGVQDGQIVSYGIRDGSNSEAGYGTYASSGTTLTRNVIVSTNSNSPISLSGSAEVYVTSLATDVRNSVLTKTSSYTATANDVGATILMNSSSATTLSLPAAATVGSGYWLTVKNINSGICTVDPNGSETIDSATTSAFPQYDTAKIVCDGSNWWSTNRPDSILLSSGSTSAAATLDLALPAGFAKIVIDYTQVEPATAGDSAWGRISQDGGSTYIASAYVYGGTYGSGTASSGGTDLSSTGTQNQISLGTNLAATPSSGTDINVTILRPDDTSYYHRGYFEVNLTNNSGTYFFQKGGFAYPATAAWTNFRLLMSTGNIAHANYVVTGFRR